MRRRKKKNKLLDQNILIIWNELPVDTHAFHWSRPAREPNRPGPDRDGCILKLKLQRRTFLLPNIKEKKKRKKYSYR